MKDIRLLVEVIIGTVLAVIGIVLVLVGYFLYKLWEKVKR